MLRGWCAPVLGSVLFCLAIGCGPTFGPEAHCGITFYCPGAGNLDFGDSGVREGLVRNGYSGQVAAVPWTVSFNVAIDQLFKQSARAGGARLAKYIADYLDRYPDGEVNLVGLSAGTGVAVWALENLPPQYKVNNVVLLSSSLYHRYDVSKALSHVSGRIYCYYSPNDAVLAGPMKILGTIDGVFMQDGAGAVGLHPPTSSDRIVNVAWQPEFARLGYYGGHNDSTSAAFIAARVAPQIMAPPTTASPEIAHASLAASGRPVARAN